MPLLDNFIPTAGHGYGGGVVDTVGNGFDPGLYRPYLDSRGRPSVVVNTGQWTVEKGVRTPIRRKQLIRDLAAAGRPLPPVVNATSLRKEEWIELDSVVLRAARQRLRAWADLAAANSFGGFNGMAKLTLEYEAMSDPGEAVVDLDGLTDGRTDSPLFQLRSLPLPITHSDFWFSERRLAVSRNTGTPLDTTMAEAAGRRVAEKIEKTTIGVSGGFSGLSYGAQTTGVTAHDTSAPSDGHGSALGASTVYGYTTYPHRFTKTNMTVPTGSNPEATVADVLAMRNTLYNSGKFYGPFMIYHSTDWDQWLDNDYARLGGSNANMTLRDRLRAIEGIQDVRRLDFLTSTYTMILVQMTADVARAVNGMDITTVQWESVGGMRKNFKVMAIQVPQIRSDYNGNCGILHGTTA